MKQRLKNETEKTNGRVSDLRLMCIFLSSSLNPGKSVSGRICILDMEVTPKSSIFIGLSIINHPFWGIAMAMETQY